MLTRDSGGKLQPNSGNVLLGCSHSGAHTKRQQLGQRSSTKHAFVAETSFKRVHVGPAQGTTTMRFLVPVGRAFKTVINNDDLSVEYLNLLSLTAGVDLVVRLTIASEKVRSSHSRESSKLV